MRLINTTTLQLEGPFFDANQPQYAILSHTWDDMELCLQSMANVSTHEYKEGFDKIKRCCERALRDGYKYVWVDTVCIDKTNGAELSESINSMYNWYAKAEVCYAFLKDLSLGGPSLEGHDSVDCNSSFYKEFSKCRWFTRGWTLQELLAPRRVVFFNAQWNEVGDRSSLSYHISAVANIDIPTLCGLSPRRLSIACRMSWASQRTTTRPEDLAYCLLGIFDINMPMLYGEGGEKAFIRLQEAILQKTDDHSIFAWKVPQTWSHRSEYWSLIAPSPRFFKRSFEYSPVSIRDSALEPTITITSRGIVLKARMHLSGNFALLACRPHPNTNAFCLMPVQRLRTGPSQYARTGSVIEYPGELDEILWPKATVVVPHRMHEEDFTDNHFVNYLRVRPRLAEDSECMSQVRFCDITPAGMYDFNTETIRLSPFLQHSTIMFFSFFWEEGKKPSFQVGFFCSGDPQEADCLAQDKVVVYNGIPTVEDAAARLEAFSYWVQNGRQGNLVGAIERVPNPDEDAMTAVWRLDAETLVSISFIRNSNPLVDTVASVEIQVKEG
ncbi:HET-domain-containing protein [Fusarium sp. LHS14.1]|nr:HET-domain-containing protein [Fusarium sp. LHS14.1]